MNKYAFDNSESLDAISHHVVDGNAPKIMRLKYPMLLGIPEYVILDYIQYVIYPLHKKIGYNEMKDIDPLESIRQILKSSHIVYGDFAQYPVINGDLEGPNGRSFRISFMLSSDGEELMECLGVFMQSG